jgi:hypothetical protein
MAAIAASVLLVAAGQTVRAEEAKESAKEVIKEATRPDNTFANKLYAADVTQQKKTFACFVREYDAAHLAKHPQQKVSAMKLLVTAELMPEDESPNHSFSLGLKFRSKPGDFRSGGSCGHAQASESENGKEHLGCSVDCDGGGIDVELSADAKSTIIRVGSVVIWDPKKPDTEDRLHLNGGTDDRVFRLDRAPLEMCKSLVNDRDELVALRGQMASKRPYR